MRTARTTIVFLIALGAFLATGGGALLLLAPQHGTAARLVGSAPARAERTRTTTPSEPRLVVGLDYIPRPDQPNRLVIPAIALDSRIMEVGVVVENGKRVWDTAAFAVGYHRGTAMPGTRGNTVMAGHISSPVSKKGDVFRHLPEVRPGDEIQVYVGQRRFTYQVATVDVVAPESVQVMQQTADARLTLITCYPDLDYRQRLVVVAKLVEDAV